MSYVDKAFSVGTQDDNVEVFVSREDESAYTQVSIWGSNGENTVELNDDDLDNLINALLDVKTDGDSDYGDDYEADVASWIAESGEEGSDGQ